MEYVDLNSAAFIIPAAVLGTLMLIGLPMFLFIFGVFAVNFVKAPKKTLE